MLYFSWVVGTVVSQVGAYFYIGLERVHTGLGQIHRVQEVVVVNVLCKHRGLSNHMAVDKISFNSGFFGHSQKKLTFFSMGDPTEQI